MKAVLCSEVNLSKVMQQVCNDGEPVGIRNHDGKAVVLLSLKEYESMNETMYLTQSPLNNKRLMESVEQLSRY